MFSLSEVPYELSILFMVLSILKYVFKVEIVRNGTFTSNPPNWLDYLCVCCIWSFSHCIRDSLIDSFFGSGGMFRLAIILLVKASYCLLNVSTPHKLSAISAIIQVV